MWEWPGEEYSLQTDSQNDFSHFLWEEVNTNEDDLSYMLEEQTPIKDCADFGYQVSDIEDNTNKGLEEIRESSQLKRRRMLQFMLDYNDEHKVTQSMNPPLHS
ncbi:protein XRI1-like [Phoenix dactylifera]|uniref:Protein XRI1-like n=1 Tax=Phoenix dactylifera TaxID=42345 RepID=A0A8B9A6H7_PHODC|nr:protein XRI1-like [Phoenix dactylifera]